MHLNIRIWWHPKKQPKAVSFVADSEKWKNQQEHEFYCSYHKNSPLTSYNAVGKQDSKQNCLTQEQGWCTSMASLVLNEQYSFALCWPFPESGQQTGTPQNSPKKKGTERHPGKNTRPSGTMTAEGKTNMYRTNKWGPSWRCGVFSPPSIKPGSISRFSSNPWVPILFFWFRKSSHHLGYITNLS